MDNLQNLFGLFVDFAFIPLCVGYLAGSIPFGLLIAKFGGAGDVRTIGSGNIGATNVLRTGRKGLAALTLLADAFKGWIVVFYFSQSFAEAAYFAGLGAFIGHLFPVWLRFKGGKGIAVYIGVLIALSLKLALIFAVIWLLVAATSRYSSLAALLATAAVPIGAYLLFPFDGLMPIVLGLMTVLAWIMHRANISRLIAGQEGKIGTKE